MPRTKLTQRVAIRLHISIYRPTGPGVLRATRMGCPGAAALLHAALHHSYFWSSVLAVALLWPAVETVHIMLMSDHLVD